jgi:hypothetical protein
MNDSSEKSERGELEDAQQIQRRVRRYARNRSLPVVVFLIVFAMLYFAVGLPSYWGGMAYRDGNAALLVVCIIALIVALAATIYLSVPWWGGQRLQQVAERLYAREGRVTISIPRGKRTWLSAALVAGYAICVQGSVILGLLGYLPTDKYMQPISAIYVVPFLVALNFLMRPATGYIPLLWPLLYALHAALIVAGAPIVFVGAWESLNILVPMVGYGLLASLISHAYSRWALHRVRTLAVQQLAGANRPPEGDRT